MEENVDTDFGDKMDLSQLERDPVTKQFHCSACGLNFKHKYSLIRHTRLHTGERPYKCELCERSFMAQDKLRAHEKKKHPTLLFVFTCDECHEEFPSSALLKAHKKQHVGIHECDVCGLILTKKGQLTAHKKVKHSDYKPFSCELCFKSFPMKYCLRRHMKCHGEQYYTVDQNYVKEKNFSCTICNVAFVEKSTLEKHIRKHIERPYECDICHVPCATKHGLSLHRSAKHMDHLKVRYECDICGKSYAWKHAVTWHKKEVHGIKKNQECPICGLQFDDLLTLQAHKKEHYGKKCYECKTCQKSFYRKTALDVHKRVHSGERPFICEICGKAFRSSACLRMHCMRGSCSYQMYSPDSTTKNDSNSDIFNLDENQKECPICHVKFRTQYILKTHLTAHPSGKQLGIYSPKRCMCNICGRYFATEGHKRMHKCKSDSDQSLEESSRSNDIDINDKNDKKPYIVTINRNPVGVPDDKLFLIAQDVEIRSSNENGISETVIENGDCDIFSTPTDIEIHPETPAVEKQHKCKICDKNFSSKQTLNIHLKSHNSEKQFECELCGKRFAHSSTRSNHRKLHSGEKPFVCEICGKTFVIKSALDVHRRIHTGERPYRCEVCGRTFAQMSTRNSHRKMHTGVRPFECGTCNKKYAERRTLNAHMKIHSHS